jgi:8-amino-7-oxononanoate synthase
LKKEAKTFATSGFAQGIEGLARRVQNAAMSRLDDLFTAELERLGRAGLRRATVPVAPAAPGAVLRDGQILLNFASNDYLGLARHPLLAERAAEYAARLGTGATASRLVCGTLEAHAAIESRVAALKGQEAAMLLASGWQANAAVLGALLRFAGPNALLFADDLNHSSLVHGARLGGTKPIRFRHNDTAHLEHLLTATADQPGPRFIATESVFSMDGDRADISRLRALAEAHNAFLYIDEAHATGVFGANGMGLCAGQPGIDLIMGTFSKALGGFGAYVAGSRALIDFLQNACAGFIYTTAPPPPVLGAIDAALDLVPTMHAERAHLATQAQRVRTAFTALGIDTAASTTHILPALVGDAAQAMALAAALRDRGVLAIAIRPPTVPAGTSRIRFALSAVHGEAAVDALITAMRACWPALQRAA